MMRRGTLSDRKERAMRKIVVDALQRHGGNKTHAARELGVDRVYIQRLIKRYGIPAISR